MLVFVRKIACFFLGVIDALNFSNWKSIVSLREIGLKMNYTLWIIDCEQHASFEERVNEVMHQILF